MTIPTPKMATVVARSVPLSRNYVPVDREPEAKTPAAQRLRSTLKTRRFTGRGEDIRNWVRNSYLGLERRAGVGCGCFSSFSAPVWSGAGAV